MTRFTMIGGAFLQGFLSMGFQLVATRVIAPYFGSTIVVWAFVISTFLTAFSVGAFIGGACCRAAGWRGERSVGVIGIVGVAGFAFIALFNRPLLAAIDSHIDNLPLALGLSCSALFFLPVAALSALLPIFADFHARTGSSSGLSVGLVYGVSTVGNVFGVMGTAFVLIPRLHTSTLLESWAVGAALCFLCFFSFVRGARIRDGAAG